MFFFHLKNLFCLISSNINETKITFPCYKEENVVTIITTNTTHRTGLYLKSLYPKIIPQNSLNFHLPLSGNTLCIYIYIYTNTPITRLPSAKTTPSPLPSINLLIISLVIEGWHENSLIRTYTPSRKSSVTTRTCGVHTGRIAGNAREFLGQGRLY